MRILVTGFAGFIGSNLTRTLFERYPQHEIFGLDAYTYAARPGWVHELIDERKRAHKSTYFLASKCDVANERQLTLLIENIKPDVVFHLAAETHVCNSIRGPRAFIHTNALGTWNLLEACRKVWDGQQRPFIHVSTDEVFGELGPTDPVFHVEHPLKPRSPYAASKAASDHFAMSYHHTYGMDVRVTNCSNNFGPNQHEEKLIPRTIQRFAAGQPMTVHGNGGNVRDWLWVGDHVDALLKVWERGAAGGRYLIGGELEMTNLSMIEYVARALGEALELSVPLDLKFTTDRPTDDRRYGVDTKTTRQLGWEPSPARFNERLLETVRWYLARA